MIWLLAIVYVLGIIAAAAVLHLIFDDDEEMSLLSFAWPALVLVGVLYFPVWLGRRIGEILYEKI